MGIHRKLRFWTHSGVKVFDNAASPTSWTDLDLSSVVGKNRALVFMKVKAGLDMWGNDFFIRIKGETEEVAENSAYAAFNNIGSLTLDHIGHFVMETDADGIIQWKAISENRASIWILGYVK